MCPLMSQQGGDRMVTQDGFVNCQLMVCRLWDGERECCSFNSKPSTVIKHKQPNISRLKNRLKANILLLLNEKTNWGRVELKTSLFSLIDGLEDESNL